MAEELAARSLERMDSWALAIFKAVGGQFKGPDPEPLRVRRPEAIEAAVEEANKAATAGQSTSSPKKVVFKLADGDKIAEWLKSHG